MAMRNGNDLRVYFRSDSDCKPREIDRILENIATASTKVWFKLQEESQAGSSYYLAYGNKDASRAKESPEGVYLFYDDFSDSDWEKKWQKNSGEIQVKNGELNVKTRGTTPRAEIAIFAKNGYNWRDIEVDLEFFEKNYGAYPGVFLRVSDASTSEKNPATSCKQIHDVSFDNGRHRLRNGVYWIKTAADRSVPTYCDLTNGGWTLVGKVSGSVDDLHTFWLIKNHNQDALRHSGLPSEVGCIDARYLATYHASTIRFSSGENRNGIGLFWVQWALPDGRDSQRLWKHSIGIGAVLKERMESVIVTAWNGRIQRCFQNKFGILPHGQAGGSYPAVSFNTDGNTKTGDYCMAIGVMKLGRPAHGWTQNTNGFDSPNTNTDWPNARYNHQAPWVTVWLK
ncbi:uncharacterized protein LOC114517176 [Dendronephthya gigantea]|uniref:uncharacterized protein LOC114517176 n=1 Tax=Dendronephthya gigantea TaxID=151771 RepID=UPI001069DD07|nr:uncharacterized protein LOC114517176 [Dendronephthya gigantea]